MGDERDDGAGADPIDGGRIDTDKIVVDLTALAQAEAEARRPGSRGSSSGGRPLPPSSR